MRWPRQFHARLSGLLRTHGGCAHAVRSQRGRRRARQTPRAPRPREPFATLKRTARRSRSKVPDEGRARAPAPSRVASPPRTAQHADGAALSASRSRTVRTEWRRPRRAEARTPTLRPFRAPEASRRSDFAAECALVHRHEVEQQRSAARVRSRGGLWRPRRGWRRSTTPAAANSAAIAPPEADAERNHAAERTASSTEPRRERSAQRGFQRGRQQPLSRFADEKATTPNPAATMARRSASVCAPIRCDEGTRQRVPEVASRVRARVQDEHDTARACGAAPRRLPRPPRRGGAPAANQSPRRHHRSGRHRRCRRCVARARATAATATRPRRKRRRAARAVSKYGGFRPRPP